MLILERSLDQRVHVYRHGTRIGTVLLQRLGHNRAWLGFEFSGEFEIVREEVDDREGTLPLHSDRARHRWTDRQLDSIYWEYPRKRSGGLITMRAAIAVSLDWLVENARNDLKTAPPGLAGCGGRLRTTPKRSATMPFAWTAGS